MSYLTELLLSFSAKYHAHLRYTLGSMLRAIQQEALRSTVVV